MKYSEKLAKFALIPSKEESRYTLKVFHLDVDASVLAATDGHRLVVHGVEVDPSDITGNIPVEALEVLRKEHKKYGAAWLDCSDPKVATVRVGDRVMYQGDRDPSRFPNWRAVLPTAGISEPAAMTVSFNAKLLFEMAQAMSDDTRAHVVTLHIRDAQSAITVQRGDDAVGVLMPCRDDKASSKLIPKFWDRLPAGKVATCGGEVVEIAAD